MKSRRYFAIKSERGFRGGVFFRDISERQRAEAALRANEEKYRNVVENANEAIVVLQDGKVKFANPRASELTGFTLDEFKNNSFVELIHPDDRHVGIENYQRRLKGEQFESVYPLRLIVKDGRTLWVEARAALINWEGRPAVLDFLTDITKRKQAEAALRESEKMYRDLVDNALVGVYRTTTNGGLLYANDTTVRICGFKSFEEMKSAGAVVRYKNPEDRQAMVAQLQTTGRVTDFEFELLRKDGESRNVVLNATLDGEIISGMILDITTRKQAEQGLRESEVKFRAIFDNASDGMFLVEQDTRKFALANSSCLRMLGYSADEFANLSIADLHPEEDLPFIFEQIGSFVKGETGTRGDIRYKRRDGSTFPADSVPAGVMLGDKKCILIVFRDVTERKQAETALREMNAYLDNLITHANAPIIVWDPNFRITRFNRAFERLTGRKESDVKGQTLDILFPASQREDSLSLIRRTATGERWETVEIPIQHIDGNVFTVLWNSATLYTPDGSVLATIAQGQDITARKQAEDALARKSTELAALDEQKNQFLGMAAHDLRNPLAVIMARSEFVLEGLAGALTPEQEKFIATMKRSSEFMLKLVNDLLDVAKIEAGKVNLELEPTDLAALLNQNIALNRVLAGKKDIRLELEVAADLPTMELDAAKIEQVLNNLVSNAVKFSNLGDVVNIRATRMNGTVSISVADHGPGIPPDDMGKLFTAFGRTSVRSASGEKDTGLGLLIVKRILEAHHGGIRVESEPGKGTIFFADLPVVRSE